MSPFETDAAVQFRCAGVACDPEVCVHVCQEQEASLAIGGQVLGAQ